MHKKLFFFLDRITQSDTINSRRRRSAPLTTSDKR